jgi:calcineurin-like phosphoesterase family protein
MERFLYDSFAQRWYRGGTVWFYSDPHFNDKEMLEKRHIGDEEQVKRINSKIGKCDTIIFLGDIGDPTFIQKIRGYKVLVMGNHEKGACNYSMFDEVYEGVLTISNKIILSHEPLDDIPYLFNIHGHDHSGKKRANHLNVCAECIDYTPVSLPQLVKSGCFTGIQDIHRICIDAATKRKAKKGQGDHHE